MNPDSTLAKLQERYRAEVRAIWSTLSDKQKAIVREEMACRFVTDFSKIPLNDSVKSALIEECKKAKS